MAHGFTGAEELRVGRIDVDTAGCLLTFENTHAKLSPRAMNVLMYLAERAGSTVTHDELLGRFWRGSLSSRNAVHKCAAELRLALGRLGDDGVQIETVSKRGYRLSAAVVRIDPEAAEEPPHGPTIASFGTRTVVIEPIKAGSSTPSGESFARRIRRELVAQLNQLTHVVVQGQTQGPVVQHARSAVGGGSRADYTVEFDVQDNDSQLYATVAVTPASAEMPFHQERFTASVALHETIAHIVDTLAVLVDPDHVERMREWGTLNAEAYRATFDGFLLYRQHSFDAMQRAAALFAHAVAKDPRFATAYVCLAAAYKDMGRVGQDTQGRERLRQQAQAVLRSAKQSHIDPNAIRDIEQLCRYMSLANPVDGEAFWRSEIVKDPGNVHALRRYGEMLGGSDLLDEAAAYLARAISLTDPEERMFVESAEASIALARGEFERAVALMKRNVERLPDYPISTYGLVGTLAKLGRYQEAELYVTRLEATSSGWGWYARLTLAAIKGDISPRSNELAHLFAHPRANNSARGAVSFMLGDVEAGVGYWREMEPGHLATWWDFIAGNEWYWAPGVVNDPRYQTLLDDLGFGRRWRVYLRSRVAELTSVTGIELTTPPLTQDVGSLAAPLRIPARG